MSNLFVTIAADKEGNLISVSPKNPEYGSIRVEQIAQEINKNGWFSFKKRSALIKGKVSDLVEAGFKVGQPLPGKIVVRESLIPFNIENPERDLKIAGESGIVCRYEDQPIYRQSFYTTELSEQDQLIMHTNTEEIREVMAATKQLSNLQIKSIVPTL